MLLTEIAQPLSFQTEVRGQYSGQIDLTLVAIDADGRPLGHIDYSEWRGEPAVQMIEVPPEHRRQGIASALVRYLQAQYPGSEIDFGTLTRDGSKLMASLPTQRTPNRDYQRLSRRLRHLRARERRYQAIADRLEAEPTEENRARYLPLLAQWNDLNSAMWNVEEALRELKPSTRLIKVES